MKIQRRRPLCERHECADIRKLKRTGEVAGRPTVIRLAGEPLRVTEIPCHFGGARLAFLCPACDRRSFTLFRRVAWACRRCHGLAYASENATPYNRRLSRAFKIRERLGQTEGGLVAPFPMRPKGQWWSTYLRERRAGQDIEQQLARALAQKFGMLA